MIGTNGQELGVVSSIRSVNVSPQYIPIYPMSVHAVFYRTVPNCTETTNLAGRLKALQYSQFFLVFCEKVGAGDEIRTHDFNLGKVALYP